MEQFISILLIFRLQLTEIPAFIYYLIIVAFFVGKFVKEGNTAGSLLQYVSFLVIVAGDLMES